MTAESSMVTSAVPVRTSTTASSTPFRERSPWATVLAQSSQVIPKTLNSTFLVVIASSLMAMYYLNRSDIYWNCVYVMNLSVLIEI